MLGRFEGLTGIQKEEAPGRLYYGALPPQSLKGKPYLTWKKLYKDFENTISKRTALQALIRVPNFIFLPYSPDLNPIEAS
ncbi:hypothetical protein [Neochlamydia sp. S13]|uniref:hypothetical protein n=1 Tax=Neochlamydia sp. S13 TaxID=1353976 RepID=UPI0005A7B947|nr:hypothetical protein [Neochlamydia sp. S13]BBI16809.1 hypothetical protein NCS13_1_0614 [Neochlamydia sp. S13]